MFKSANGSLCGSSHYFRISFSYSFSSVYRVLKRCIHESFQQLPEDSALLVAPCTRSTTHPRWHFFPLPRMFLSSNTLLQQDNFSSLKCRSTLLEYIRVQNPAAGLSPHYYFDLTSSETESERAWTWAESSVQSHVIRTNSNHSSDLRLVFLNLHFAVHRFCFWVFMMLAPCVPLCYEIQLHIKALLRLWRFYKLIQQHCTLQVPHRALIHGMELWAN
jgi:hypothetical protein